MISHTGFVKEVNFVFNPIFHSDSVTIVRFDDERVLVFCGYNFYIPKNRNVSFRYYYSHNFRNNPLYKLDSFRVL